MNRARTDYNAANQPAHLSKASTLTGTETGMKYTSLMLALAALYFSGSAIAEERHEQHVHHHFPKDVDAFHSTLAPVWHSPSGPERARKACAKADEMEDRAKDIRSGDATQLVAAVVTLKKKCQGSQADIDAALADVHEAFHRLAEPH